MERIEVQVRGRVQMVMFRDFVQRKASSLGLTGEVMNLTDGSVYVIAEGEQKVLQKLVHKLHKGPLLARVEKVEVQTSSATGTYTEFTLILDTRDTV